MRRPILVATFSSSTSGGGTTLIPIIDLNGASSGVDQFSSYAAGNPATYVLLDATVTDADSANLASLTIVGTTWGDDGADEQLEFGAALFPSDADFSTTRVAGATTFAIAYTASTKTFAISKNGGGVFPPADATTLLQEMAYWNQAITPTEGNRVFTIVANDGVNTSDTATLTISVLSTVAYGDLFDGVGVLFDGVGVIIR